MLGAAIALLSALSFSLSDILVRRGVAKAPVSQGTFITILMGVPLFAIAALATGQLLSYGELSSRGYALLGTAGIVHYVVGRYFNYAAIGAIGAARASPVQSLTLPYSVIIAWLFLGEGVSTGMAIGMLLILVGPAIIVERRSGRARALAAETALEGPPPSVRTGTDGGALETVPTAPPAAPAAAQPQFELRQVEGYAFALIAAISYGSSPVFIRAALEGHAELSVFGGLVSYVAASAVLIAGLVLPGRRQMVRALRLETVRAFFGAGFFVFLAQMLRFTALSLASVAVVATLLRFAGLFTLLLSWAVNRNLERITWRLVAGVVMSVAGAVLMVLTRTD